MSVTLTGSNGPCNEVTMTVQVFYSDRHRERVAQQIKINHKSLLLERITKTLLVSLALTVWTLTLVFA